MTNRTARHVPKHQGPAAWAAILPDVPPGPPLTENITSDLVIIGAGFAGLSAARRAIQIDPTLDITVLDAGRIAEGAAGRNSGFMIDLPHDLASEDYAGAGNDAEHIHLNRRAQAFGAEMVAEYDIPPAYFDKAGKVNGAVSDAALAHNDSYAKHLESLGEPIEIMDAAAMRDMTGSSYYKGGLYTPGTVMLQPAGYIQGVARGLRAQGVHIYETSAVTGYAHRGAEWGVTTTRGSVTAPKIILAVNGHLESFGHAKNRLMQLFLFAVMTPELAPEQIGGADRWGITPSDPMGTTVRRIDAAQGGSRIITRTCAVLRPNKEATKRNLTRAAHVMQRKFDARFPQLAGLKMAHQWAGHLCLSRNRVSVTKNLDKGVWSACVQNGLGTARGTLTGIAAAEMALGISTDVTSYFAKEDIPTQLPPRPFREIGANSFLRYREWIARSE